MNQINIFIKKEFIFLFIIFIVFINPFFYGYRIAMLFFVFMFFNIKYLISNIDVNVFYLFLFTLSYELISSVRYDYVDKGIVAIIPNIFVPSLLYLVGKYVSVNYKNHQIWVFFMFFITFAFSLIPMISILLQVQENGFIEGTRSMYLIWDQSFEISATGLGSYFTLNMASIGLINVKKNTKTERNIFIGIAILFVLALVCVLRLGSRTQLVLAVVSLLGTFLWNFRQNSFLKKVLFIASLSVLIFFMVNNFDENADVMKFYSDRLNNEEVGIGSAGGRTERWMGALESIITDPFGWELSRFGYAHNLWLDVARVAGIIPLLFLILFTVSAIKTWFKSLQILGENLYLKNYVSLFFISIILLFSVEPIMEGMYLLFLLFCTFIGFLKGMSSKSKKNL
jgi:hypothetical protein